MAAQESQACNFQDPESLKDILDLLVKLYTTGTMPKVFEKLRDGLEPYCGVSYLQAFYSDHRLGYSYAGSGSILILTQAAEGIGRELLQKPPGGGHITDPHKGHTDCIQKYSEALKACLPKLFSALLFLFFNVAKECNQIGGGSWNSLPVKGSGTSLGQWLIGEDSESDLIPRKFSKEELHGSNTGQKVVEPLKTAVSLTPNTDYGSLQNVLCGFMFVCPWHDPLTGHACLFLYKFCDEVGKDSGNAFRGKFQEKYSGKKYEELKGECQDVKSQLDSLVKGTYLSAVCQKNTKLFDGIWDNGKFDKYCDWLKRNLEALKKSLEKMSSEAPQWTPSALEKASSAGPFKYGFVFKDKSWEDGKINSNLQPLIKSLTGGDSGSLNSLLQCLNGEYSATSERLTTESTQSSSGAAAAGAAGGILSLGGAGVGAAYGFNLFGLKDIMSGVFGAIRGLVVGF